MLYSLSYAAHSFFRNLPPLSKSRLSRIKPKIVSFNVSQYVFLKNYRDKEKNISDIKKVVLIGDCLITSGLRDGTRNFSLCKRTPIV